MRCKKFSPGSSGRRGFTLVEIIVVLSIVAILAAAIIPTMIGLVDKSWESTLDVNRSTVYQMLYYYSYDYDESTWYDSWNHDGTGSLNNRMENELEVVNNGHYENDSRIQNPYSKRLSILDYDSTISSGDGYRPAVFLTANSSYAYTGGGSTNNIIGSVVCYFEVSGGVTEYVDIYYVNKDGEKSRNVLTVKP